MATVVVVLEMVKMVAGMPRAQQIQIFATVRASRLGSHGIYSVGHSLRAAAILLHVAECLHVGHCLRVTKFLHVEHLLRVGHHG